VSSCEHRPDRLAAGDLRRGPDRPREAPEGRQARCVVPRGAGPTRRAAALRARPASFGNSYQAGTPRPGRSEGRGRVPGQDLADPLEVASSGTVGSSAGCGRMRPPKRPRALSAQRTGSRTSGWPNPRWPKISDGPGSVAPRREIDAPAIPAGVPVLAPGAGARVLAEAHRQPGPAAPVLAEVAVLDHQDAGAVRLEVARLLVARGVAVPDHQQVSRLGLRKARTTSNPAAGRRRSRAAPARRLRGSRSARAESLLGGHLAEALERAVRRAVHDVDAVGQQDRGELLEALDPLGELSGCVLRSGCGCAPWKCVPCMSKPKRRTREAPA
jgi:hypothetical protein